MDFLLRRASRADAVGVAVVYVASWNQGFAGLMPPRVLDRDQVVGFAGTGPSRDPLDPELGELDTIAVRPDAWRRGVGRRLMSAALDDLAAHYAEGILWTLAGHGNGRGCYGATGWHASSEVRDSGRQFAFRRPLDGPRGCRQSA